MSSLQKLSVQRCGEPWLSVDENNTTIIGAQATGNSVLAAIGGNLTLASEQDTDDYASKQWQVGGTFVYGAGGSLSASQSNINSHYASVNDISGIGAGSGGFQIVVNGNTDLNGAVITSRADPSLNLLNTGSLTYRNIQNQANYSASEYGINLGYNAKGGGIGNSGIGASPILGIPQNGSENSVTQAGIANGTILVRDNPNQDLSGLNRNPTLDNQSLKTIFDVQKVQNNLIAGQIAGQVGMTAAGDLGQYMANHATTDAEKASWSSGGTNSTLLHGIVGAATAATSCCPYGLRYGWMLTPNACVSADRTAGMIPDQPELPLM